MDITNDIITRLQNGEKIEDIASEITKSINEANAQYEAAEKAKKEAAAREAAQENLRNDKINAMETLLIALTDTLALWEFDSDLLDALEELDAEELVDVIDQSMPFINKYLSLAKEFGEISKPAVEAKKKPATDPLEEFLNTFVRH